MSDYTSTGPIEVLDFGRMKYHVVYLEPAVAETLPFDGRPRLRVEGEIGDVPISLAWTPSGDGRHYLLLSKKLLEEGDWSLGDVVTVRFDVADQDAVEVPPELAAALAADGQFRSAWDELPPGRRRGLCYRVDTAKRPETRARRVAEVREEVLVGPAEPPPARRRTGRRPGRDR